MTTTKQIGLRIISNIHCNSRCNFCYQKDKSNKILSLDTLTDTLKSYPDNYFEYCTIMGGESTLLSNLCDYIKIASKYTKQIRLTTNGILLNENILKEYKDVGLTGINISIHKILLHLNIAKIYFSNTVRVNIPLCKENVENGGIFDLIDIFLLMCGVGVTICEDRKPSFSILNELNLNPSYSIESDNGNGIIFYIYRGKRFAYFSHADKYNDDNLIITPYGIFNKWSDYCDKID